MTTGFNSSTNLPYKAKVKVIYNTEKTSLYQNLKPNKILLKHKYHSLDTCTKNTEILKRKIQNYTSEEKSTKIS